MDVDGLKTVFLNDDRKDVVDLEDFGMALYKLRLLFILPVDVDGFNPVLLNDDFKDVVDLEDFVIALKNFRLLEIVLGVVVDNEPVLVPPSSVADSLTKSIGNNGEDDDGTGR